MKRISAQSLQSTVTRLFQSVGLSEDDAVRSADVLVSADLRGISTHGVSNMLEWYLSVLSTREVNPRPEIRTLAETDTTATLDSDSGLGLAVAPHAMRAAIAKARTHALGMVTVRNGRHLGMGQYHAMMALPEQMIGLCLTSTDPLVVPTFGASARLGTNPIAFAAPAGTSHPFVFDAALSVVPGNRVVSARAAQELLPAGVLAAADGTPIMEPTPPPPTGFGSLLPLGSTFETGSHKGYGLACIVEILTKLLGGWGFLEGVGEGRNCHMLMAIDVSAFVPFALFTSLLDEFLEELESTPAAPGRDRVLTPGQLEWETEVARRSEGIPLPDQVLSKLYELCDTYHVQPALDSAPQMKNADIEGEG